MYFQICRRRLSLKSRHILNASLHYLVKSCQLWNNELQCHFIVTYSMPIQQRVLYVLKVTIFHDATIGCDGYSSWVQVYDRLGQWRNSENRL